MDEKSYQSTFSNRYGSPEMRYLFSPHFKYTTWRKLWIALAKGERLLGVPISQEQVDEMAAHVEDIDLAKADEYEKTFHHDVVAHIYAYADQCPNARPIIHLGATSCFVTDNTDLIQMRDGMLLLHSKLLNVIKQLSSFAMHYADTPCLSFTHFQPAQVTTVGKRACLWIQDFLFDVQELKSRLENLRFLGVKGATGTQASFLTLFENDDSKVQQLDRFVAEEMGFSKRFIISGQTYTRKQDVQIFSTLAEIGISAHKMATDLRLLAHLEEIEEPFEEKQVGSSAMPYKRNPILSERICSLSRFLISLFQNPAYTAATQWFERTLDDSANRRLSIPEAFLCCDAILDLLLKVTKGLIVNSSSILQHIQKQLPFLAAETILMQAVKKGGDRQALHERIRSYWQETTVPFKENVFNHDFLEKIQKDPDFFLSIEEMNRLKDISQLTGCASRQVREFIEQEIGPIIKSEF